MTTYIPKKTRESEARRAALFTQLERVLKSGTEKERIEATFRMSELQVSGEKLEASANTVGPLKETISELEKHVP